MGFEPGGLYQRSVDKNTLNTCSKVNSELSKINKEQDKLNEEIQKALTCDESSSWEEPVSTDVELAKERIKEIEQDKVDLQSLFETLKKRKNS